MTGPFGSAGGETLSAGLTVVRPPQKVEKVMHTTEITGFRHVDGLLGEVVAQNVLGVDAVHALTALLVGKPLLVRSLGVLSQPGA